MQVTEFSTNVDREKLLAISCELRAAPTKKFIPTCNAHITLSTRYKFNHF